MISENVQTQTKKMPRKVSYFLGYGFLLLLMLPFFGCGDLGPGQQTILSEEIYWREGGEDEVRAYLQALNANEIFVTMQEGVYQKLTLNISPSLEVSVEDSRVYASADSTERESIAQKLAIVLWDNLEPDYDEYSVVSILFRDEQGLLEGEHYIPTTLTKNSRLKLFR